jgi:hypothetical protein
VIFSDGAALGDGSGVVVEDGSGEPIGIGATKEQAARETVASRRSRLMTAP